MEKEPGKGNQECWEEGSREETHLLEKVTFKQRLER